MDKKNKKKTVIKRKSDEASEGEKKAKTMVARKVDDEKDKVEVVSNQVVELPVEQGQQIVHTGQLVEGNFEQPVFVNMKGEPVQLGPNTVILYEQSGNPSNFAFGGMWTMDSSGRIVMAETIYDVKGEPEEENNTFVQNTAEVSNQQQQVEESSFQQYEITNNTQVEQQQEYEVAIIEPMESERTTEASQPLESLVLTTEEQLTELGAAAVRWLNHKYDFVVRKLQLNYDAGVKLYHSEMGCLRCVYFTTPSMQLAFNAVPQFLCIETGIEFNTVIPAVGVTDPPSVKQSVTLFLAEDGNGKSVIVSAGISMFLNDDVTWLLETFKSCNPAWRQVRCVVADPKNQVAQQYIKLAFPSAHVTCSVWQAARAGASLIVQSARRENIAATGDIVAKAKTYALALLRAEHTMQQLQVCVIKVPVHKAGITVGACDVFSVAGASLIVQTARRENIAATGDIVAKAKTYALALLRTEHTMQQLQVLKRGIIGTGAGTLRLWETLHRPGGAISKLDQWLGPDNYTNILHKGLERLVTKFQALVRPQMQPDEFVSVFFNVSNQLEEERRTFAINRLRDTEALKQSPTDTITQYAYNLMSHQTKLAQKCLDERIGKKNASADICKKYGTSTQECSCLFSKVFKLPCRHILMLTTELKVKTHIPFEPRWTVQHCLFGCDNPPATVVTSSANNANSQQFMEQVVVETDSQHRQTIQQPQTIHQQVGGVRQQQYVLATPGQTGGTPVSQVIFCGNPVGGAPVITSVLPAGGAVLTPHHS